MFVLTGKVNRYEKNRVNKNLPLIIIYFQQVDIFFLLLSRTRVAHFLEKQGFKQQALAVSTDPEHR